MTRVAINPREAVAINATLVAARQAIDVLCDRWSLALVIAALLGETRFSGLMERTGIASRLLTARLRALETAGVFMRVPVSMRPPRTEYRLTNKGAGLFDVVIQMLRWEQAWTPDFDQGPFSPTHGLCGAPLHPELRCGACGKPATARDIVLKVSAGQLRHMPAKQSAHRRSTVSGARHAATHRLLGASLDIFGDKWGIEVLLCAFSRIRRFNDFRACTGISTNILSDRLERLTASDVLRKVADTPSEAGYRLTPKGLDLYGVMVAIQDWADFWLPDRYRSPVRLIHRDCGRPFNVLATCGACHAPLRLGDVALRSGG